MKRVISVGIQDFESLRKCGAFYVDKTDFIREWWEGMDSVTLITRPRRFGKTLNMSMLECFFSLRYTQRGELFEGLKIWENPGYRALQGTWPVIFLSFANIKEGTWELAREKITMLLVNLYGDNAFLLDQKWFSDLDRQLFNQVNLNMSDAAASNAIHQLCVWLQKYYGKKVLIFLDEYDTPLQEAYINGYWKQMSAYIRSLFNSTFKTNPALERAILTGITRVSKESIFSDLNNLSVVTTTSGMYASAFGFTEKEVFSALEEQEFPESARREVKAWYDGFTFGDVTDIYNPWSIINYLKNRKVGLYWANSSGNGLIGNLLRTGGPDIKEQFEVLLSGGYLVMPLDEQIVFNQLDDNPNAIWSLLLASGYLKVLHAQTYEEVNVLYETPKYTLMLTNLEVKMMFQQMVQGWFAQGGGLSGFVRAMVQGDAESMEIYLNDLIFACMSSFDGGNMPSARVPENFYHGLVLGLLADQTGDYIVRSNRESGYGRYDVMMEPRKTSDPAVILEFKVLNPRKGETTLEETAASALLQIEDRKYDTELLSRGFLSEHILKYALAFQGKHCLIRKA